MRWLFFIGLLLIPGCASINPWADSEHENTESVSSKNEDGALLDVFKLRPNEMDLLQRKYAQMWAKVGDLEAMIHSMRGRIRVIEKSSRLGLPIPEEPVTLLEEPNSQPAEAAPRAPQEEPRSQAKGTNSDVGSFKTDLAEAESLFSDGLYGKAYIAFTQVHHTYTEAVSKGLGLYWMGRCWAMLGDQREALTTLEQFVEEFPASPMVASALFQVAKSQIDLGEQAQAVATLQKIIRIYPYEAPSEAAKQLLISMRDGI